MFAVILSAYGTIGYGQNPSFSSHRVDSLLESGTRYHDSLDFANAINCYLEVHDIAEALGKDSLYKEVSYHLARAYNDMTADMQLDEAIRRYKTALEYLEQANLKDSTVLETQSIIKYNLASARADEAAQKAHKSGDFTVAIKLMETAVRLYGEIYGTANNEYAFGLNLLGTYCNNNGEYEKAIRYEKEAAVITEIIAGKDNTDYATSMYNLGLYHYSSGKFMEAIGYLKEAETLYKSLLGKNSQEYAKVLEDLSSIFSILGNYDSALKYLTDAVEILEGIGNETAWHDHVYGLTRLASLYNSLDKYSEALATITKAETSQRKAFGMHNGDYIKILRDIAAYNIKLGYFAAAQGELDKAIRLAKIVYGHESVEYAEILGDLSHLQYKTGHNTEAIDSAGAALTILYKYINKNADRMTAADFDYAISTSTYIISSLSSISSLIFQTREIFDTTYKLIGQFLEAIDPQEYPSQYCTLLADIAYIKSLDNDFESAIELIRKYLEISADVYGTQTLDYAYYLNMEGVWYSNAGKYKEAIQKVMEAMAIADRLTDKKHNHNILYRMNLASLNAHENNIKELDRYATETSNLASALIKDSFAGMTADERAYFWEQYESWFGNEIHWLACTYKTEALISIGYNASLLSKGLLLNSEMEFSQLIRESGDKNAVSLFNEWISLRQQADRMREHPDTNTARVIDSLDATAYEKERLLMQKSKIFGDYTANLAINWQQVWDRLAPDEAAVEFVTFSEGTDSTMYAAYILRKDLPKPVMISLFEENELFERSSLYWYITPFASRLIWKPLEKILEGINTVYFSPAGELYNIAIENLQDTEGIGLLSDSKKYYRLSSTRELALRRYDRENNGKAAVYGGIYYAISYDALVSCTVNYSADYPTPDSLTAGSLRRTVYNAGLPEYLPSTKIEAEKIKTILDKANIPTELYSEDNGTEASFKALSGKHTGLIHIATHGFYWNGHEDLGKIDMSSGQVIKTRGQEYTAMTRSGLLFSGASYSLSGHTLPDNLNDGILTAQEISTLDFRGLDLVVLSACQTGLGQISGDGVFGLQRGFKKAGAKTLLMSLWNVDDKATQMLMEQFYRHLVYGMDKYQALHKAQKYLREYEEETVLPDNRNFMEKRMDEKTRTEYVPKTILSRPYVSPRYWAAFIIMDAIADEM